MSAGAFPQKQQDDARDDLRETMLRAQVTDEALAASVLVAPADGTLYRVGAQPGELVGPESSVVLLDQTSRLVVRVGQEERNDMHEGQRAEVVSDTGRSVALGTVASIAPAPDAADGLTTAQRAPRVARLPGGTRVTVRRRRPCQQCPRRQAHDEGAPPCARRRRSPGRRRARRAPGRRGIKVAPDVLKLEVRRLKAEVRHRINDFSELLDRGLLSVGGG
ncbi:MAG: HlyD family secretion protein [Myxococcota bacterium]|nr:HlyD family secretion protein [Myxococcota bacterium]